MTATYFARCIEARRWATTTGGTPTEDAWMCPHARRVHASVRTPAGSIRESYVTDSILTSTRKSCAWCTWPSMNAGDNVNTAWIGCMRVCGSLYARLAHMVACLVSLYARRLYMPRAMFGHACRQRLRIAGCEMRVDVCGRVLGAWHRPASATCQERMHVVAWA